MKVQWKYLLALILPVGAGIALLWVYPAVHRRPSTETPDAVHEIAYQLQVEPIQPIPTSVDLNSEKVALGRKLFHEVRLSHDNSLSCATCHDTGKGGVDGLVHSIGIGKAEVPLNAPTVLNSGLNFRQFWNGRAETLEAQVDGPTQGPKEMGSTWPEILDKLRSDNDYVGLFQKLYPEGLTHDTVKNAIATFERSLITPNAPFDRYLRGDQGAISPEAQRGYQLFKAYGCSSCHQGVNVGGNMFQKMGVMKDYFAERGHIGDADFGCFNMTHKEEDRFVFRVPSLRNIALTAPYFHDGSTQELDAAVEVMAKYQLGRVIDAEHVHSIVAFLQSLTGELKEVQP